MLQPKNADFVTEEEMKEHLDGVLKLYLKTKEDDKSGLCTHAFLQFCFPVHNYCATVLGTNT